MSLRHGESESQTHIEPTSARRQSTSRHSALNLKPVVVISHLKRRVKQKRDEKNHAAESLSDATGQRISERSNGKGSQSHNESTTGMSSSSNRDRPRSSTSHEDLQQKSSLSENETSNPIENGRKRKGTSECRTMTRRRSRRSHVRQ